MAAPFSVSKASEKYVVIANQCRNTGVALSKDSLRSQSAFPCKCETDEGLASPYGRGAPAGAERACFTLSVGFAASSPKVGAKGERIVTGGTRAEIFMESRNIRTGFCFGPMRASAPTDSDGRSSKSSRLPSASPGFLTGIFPAPGRSSPGRHTPAFPGRLRSPG